VKERYEWSEGGGTKAGMCRQLRLSAVANAMADKADCGLRIYRAGFVALLSVKVAHFREDFAKIAQPFIRFLGEAVD
jgi:hypothetical protein